MQLKKLKRFDQRKAADGMEEKNEFQFDKEKIVLTMAHEIRSPLAAIKLANQLLQQATERDDIDKPLIDSLMKVIDHNVLIIDDYIKDTLMTKMNKVIGFRRVNIADCLDQAI